MRFLCVVLGGITLTFLVGCASTVLINSIPPGADVYVDGQYLGKTPTSYTDSAIIFAKHTVQLKIEGYEPVHASFTRNAEFNVGAFIGGCLVTVPYLWIMDYPSTLQYKLEPVRTSDLPLHRGPLRYKETRGKLLPEEPLR